MLKGVKSGSILLFHNDLENTTEALPQILTQLKSEGYEFVPVSELIYWDNYTIDSAGKQIPDLQSSIRLTPEKVEEVLAEYSNEIIAAGLNEEQMLKAAEALKGGVEIPADIAAELPDDIAEVIAKLSVEGDYDLDSLAPRTANDYDEDDDHDGDHDGDHDDHDDHDDRDDPDSPEEIDDDINDVVFDPEDNKNNVELSPDSTTSPTTPTPDSTISGIIAK